MTHTSTLDLAEQATRRAEVAALLGALLLAEPSTDLAELVSTVPPLLPLASGQRDLAVEYERLFLRELSLYESVFTSPDGQRGGPAAATVADFYAAHGIPVEGRWRVAGPDHLGLELRCYAHLCIGEARAWEDARPDRATQAVEVEREFLLSHLSTWGGVACDALERRARDSPYGALARATGEFLQTEANRLRPAPEHPRLPPIHVDPSPQRAGAARIARWLLAPARSGIYLDVEDLAHVAERLALPWRPSDSRQRLRELVNGAMETGELATLLEGLRPPVERWHEMHTAHESACDGAQRIWGNWRKRTEETLQFIDRLVKESTVERATNPERPVQIVVSGSECAQRELAAQAVLERLSDCHLRVAVVMELRPRLASAAAALFAAGADEIMLAGEGVTALAWVEADGRAAQETRNLSDADVVLRIRPSAGPIAVTFDPTGTDHTSLQVAAAIAGMQGPGSSRDGQAIRNGAET